MALSYMPAIFLCDCLSSSYFESEEKVLLSALAIDDLLAQTDTPPDDHRIQEVAEFTLQKAVAENKLEKQFRFHSIERQFFSGELKSKKESDVQLEVWGVRFVDDSLPANLENPKPNDCIVVWVASDLMTSELSVDEWDPRSRRQR
jgi:hypothetical protein